MIVAKWIINVDDWLQLLDVRFDLDKGILTESTMN